MGYDEIVDYLLGKECNAIPLGVKLTFLRGKLVLHSPKKICIKELHAGLLL
jgi:hypothetical protein